MPPTGPGMSAAILTGVLRSGPTQPFTPTELDRELLSVCDAAGRGRIPLVLVLPFAATDAAVTLAAAAVVSAVVDRRELGVAVAVAARNLASATSYDRLYLRDQQLAQFISRARISPGGDVSVLRRGTGAAGRLYVAGGLERLDPVLPEVEALVIDSSAEKEAFATRLDSLLVDPPARAPLVVYLARSPLDPDVALLRDRGAIVWSWDTYSARQLARPAPVSYTPIPGKSSAGAATVPMHVLRDAGDTQLLINAPQPTGESDTEGSHPPTFDEALTSLWRAIGALAGTYQPGPDERKATGSTMRWLWSTYYVVASLPVPADRYDEHASANPYVPTNRLSDVARVAREFARASAGERREAWYAVATAFEDALAAPNGKFAALTEWVRDVTARGGHSVIAVRDRTSAAALTEALASSTDVPDRWDVHVQVVRVADVISAVADHARDFNQHVDLCLTGPLPKSAAGLLAAPPARQVTVLVAGPLESARVYRAATQARRQLAELRWESTELSAALLDVEPAAPFVRTDPGADIELGEYAGAVPDDDGSNPWDPFTADVSQLIYELLAEVASSTEDGPPPPVRFTDGALRRQVEAVVLQLKSPSGRHAWLALEPNDLLTRRRRERLERAAAKSIEPGDDALLVDQQARRDLLTAMLEKLSESVAYSTLTMLIGMWHERAALVRGGDMTYEQIRRRMEGTTITASSTVGGWVRGDVDGPQDKKDVARFAKAVGDTRLAAEAERVGWALTTLHRVHRKAGAWLSSQLGGATLTTSDATVDAALNIHVADLLEAVTLWEVEHVENGRLRVDTAVLGLLLNESELDALRHRAATQNDPQGEDRTGPPADPT